MKTPLNKAFSASSPYSPVIVKNQSRKTNRHVLGVMCGALLAALSGGVSQAATVTLNGSDNFGSSSFNSFNTNTNNGLDWSNNAAPSAGNVYTVTLVGLRGPASTASATFGGDSLTINPGTLTTPSQFIIKAQSVPATPQILTVNNFILNGGALRMADAVDNHEGDLAGNMSVTANSYVGAGNTGGANVETLGIESNISGSGNLQIDQGAATFYSGYTDAGIVLLSGSNGGFTGSMTVGSASQAGAIFGATLRAGSTTAFSASSAMIIANAALTTVDLNNFNNSIGSLSGGGATGGNVTLGSATLTTGSDNTSTSFAGVISGTGAVTKVGTGTQAFSGANTYSGGTAVNGGTLLLANGTTGSATGTGTLTVANGATIGGAGKSASSSFAIGTAGAGTANVLVGNGVDATSQTTITGTSASTFTKASLTLNLDSASTNSNVLNVGNTSITFANTTLSLNLLGVGAIPKTRYTHFLPAAAAPPSTALRRLRMAWDKRRSIRAAD